MHMWSHLVRLAMMLGWRQPFQQHDAAEQFVSRRRWFVETALEEMWQARVQRGPDGQTCKIFFKRRRRGCSVNGVAGLLLCLEGAAITKL